jgi:hypothetical protein
MNLPHDGPGTYSGFYIEARDPAIGLDTAVSDRYEPGVLISSIIPEPLQLIPGIRNMLIRPREEMNDPEDLSRAAFQPDNPGTALDESTFTDTETGITIQVLRRNADGSFDVRVRWIDPPRPDMVTADIFLTARPIRLV